MSVRKFDELYNDYFTKLEASTEEHGHGGDYVYFKKALDECWPVNPGPHAFLIFAYTHRCIETNKQYKSLVFGFHKTPNVNAITLDGNFFRVMTSVGGEVRTMTTFLEDGEIYLTLLQKLLKKRVILKTNQAYTDLIKSMHSLPDNSGARI